MESTNEEGGEVNAAAPAEVKNESSPQDDMRLEDMANSVAIHALSQYLRDGVVDDEACHYYESSFRKIHDCVYSSYRREKGLLKKAKQLNNELLSEKIKLEKQNIRKTEETSLNANLLKEKENALKEVSECMERDTVITYEITELQREHAELLRQKEEMVQENAHQVEPEIRKESEAYTRLTEELNRVETCIKNDTKRREEYNKRFESLTESKKVLEERRAIERKQLAKIKNDPERIQKQEEKKRLQERVDIGDNRVSYQQKKQQEAEEVQKELNDKLDMHRSTIEQRQRDLDQIYVHLHEEKTINHQCNTRRVEIALSNQQCDENLRSENEKWNRCTKEFDRLKKTLKKKQMLTDSAKSMLPNLRNQVVDSNHQITAFQTENKTLEKELELLKEEKDVCLARIFRQQTIEQGKKDELEKFVKIVKKLEAELSQWMNEEVKQNKIIQMLTAQREVKAREATKAISNERDTKQNLKMKELIILDLAKKCNETNNRLKEFSALYDVVKNERNKYVNLIQTSSQAVAEMKEKIKILQNEVEVLRNESVAKDKALAKERLAHQTSQCSRDGLRLDTNKCQAMYRVKQEQVEQQIVEIDKLNSIINGMEREMLSLKRKYELAIDARNATGVELIDRNDELCILYEKSNVEEMVLKKGLIAIQEKDQELRMLRINLTELQRQIHVKRKQLPKVPEYAQSILTLQKELEIEREMTEMLCRDLETPQNDDRWRALGGEDPDAEQLAAKIQVLEERLHQRKEQLLEKELVLEEITGLADKLREQASEGRGDTLRLAKRVNDFQTKIKEITRQMMATVSELSMYQATAMQLQQEKHDRQQEFEECVWNSKEGRPPNERTEQEWYRRERSRLQLMEQRYEQQHAAQNNPFGAQSKSISAQIKRTTAEPRPNAYIPDDLGIPKPYGNLAPFKPTDPGSSMRHIRNPTIKDVEI